MTARDSQPDAADRPFELLRGTPGRTPKYDWQAIFAAVDDLYAGDDPPRSFAEAARRVIRAFEEADLEPPDIDYLRVQVSQHMRARHGGDDGAGTRRAAARGARNRGWVAASAWMPAWASAALTLLGVGGLAIVWINTPPSDAKDGAWSGLVREAAALHPGNRPGQASIDDARALDASRRLLAHLGKPVCLPAAFEMEEPDDTYILTAVELIKDRRAAYAYYKDHHGDRMTLLLHADPPSDGRPHEGYAEHDRVRVVYWSFNAYAAALAVHDAEVAPPHLALAAGKLAYYLDTRRLSKNCKG